MRDKRILFRVTVQRFLSKFLFVIKTWKSRYEATTVSHYETRSPVNYNPGLIFNGNWSWICTDLPSIQPRLADPLHTSVAHSWMIPIAGNITSSCPLTNKEASIGNAPAARMAWMFFRHLLQLHNAMHVWWVSLKSSSPLGAFLWRRLLSGWIMLTWEKFNDVKIQRFQNLANI